MSSNQDDRICQICQRSYSRNEHLKRHLLSHSGLAPHKCPRCSSSFRRKDVLGRHLRTCNSRPQYFQHSSGASPRLARKRQQCESETVTPTPHEEGKEECTYPEDLLTPSDRDNTHLRSNVLDRKSVSALDIGTVAKAYSYKTPIFTDNDVAGGVHENEVILQRPTRRSFPLSRLSTPVLLPELIPCWPIMPPATSFDFLLHFTEGYDLKRCFMLEGEKNEYTIRVPGISLAEEDGARMFTSTDTIIDNDFHANVTSRHPGSHSYHSALADIEAHRKCYRWTRPSEYQMQNLLHQPWLSITETKTHEICLALRATLPQWSTLHGDRCFDFFSPTLVAEFLELYWSSWYPNWPVIHKPTFHAMTTPIPLLVAMVLIGACNSFSKYDRESAWYWFDTVEKLVFWDLEQTSNRDAHRQVQSVQAAFLVCIYQTWDGCDTARRRIRRFRFNLLVTATRELDMASVKHNFPTSFEKFEWTAFIQIEEKIRTILWTFCLDTAYVIFNNMPPRYVLRELRLGLASCEIGFQAETARDCFSALQSWIVHTQRPPNLSFYSLTRMIFNPKICAQALKYLAHESFINIWCVISALHVVLYNLDPVINGEQQFESLRIAVENWASVWQRRLKNNNERFFDTIIATAALHPRSGAGFNSWKRPGFWKNATEYWLLVRTKLDRMESALRSAEAANELSGLNGLHREVSNHSSDEVDDDTMLRLHNFLLNNTSTL